MTEEQLKLLKIEFALDGSGWVSDSVHDAKVMGRDRYCCHADHEGIKPSPHSSESSNRLFKLVLTGKYLIPCMNHLHIYEKESRNGSFQEVQL